MALGDWSSMRVLFSSLIQPRPPYGLTSPTHVDLYDYGLSGPEGVGVALRRITRTTRVTHINLGHNPLGDKGVASILDSLCHSELKTRSIEEINLNNCDIGDAGLHVISRYIKRNTALRRIFLMNNQIAGTRTIAKTFADALNHSKVQTVVLTGNGMLSDNFLIPFLNALHTPHLRTLQLSGIGLTCDSIPTFSKFLLSPACYGLRSLHLNANMLSYDGLNKLTAALLAGNTTLCEMEVFANSTPEANEDTADDTNLRDTTLKALALMMARNMKHLKTVEYEARALLVVARTTLLGREDDENAEPWSFPWCRLAPELQFYILHFVHPVLSDAQHARVCNYASDKATLPSLRVMDSCSNRECIDGFLIEVGCNRYESLLP